MAVVTMSQITTTLHKAIGYIADPDKTERGALVSANFSDDVTDPAELARRMMATVERSAGGNRVNGVLAHHVIQSFSPEDSRRMTARELHELGVRFADEFTGGEYRYVIATHVDRGHTHNHIIICATSDVTFRKMRTKPGATIRRLREISDRLCQEVGLDVLPELRPERERRRHGVSFAELYSSAKGDAIKDRIRSAIDTAAGTATDFDSFARELNSAGVTVVVRGRHLTFTDMASGLRVRDVKLGRAYDELNIMARIGRHTVMPIGFNRRMIAERTDSAVRVWLPGTRRRLLVTIPLTRVVRDGDTYRAYLPAASQQIITGRKGRYAKQILAEDLYGYFSRPPALLEPAVRERMKVTVGKSEAQRRWYAMQAQRLDELNQLAAELNTASRLVSGGTTVDDAIDATMRRIEAEREAFQAALVAICDTAETAGGGPPSDDAAVELRERERRLDELARELDMLRRVRAQARHAKQRRHIRQPE